MADKRLSSATPPRARVAATTRIETAAQRSPRETENAAPRGETADDARRRRQTAAPAAPSRR